MSRKERLRWLGMAAMIGGALLTIYDLGSGLIPVGFVEASRTWTLLYAVGMFAAFFLLLGVIGLYAYQADQGGVFGLLVFVMTLLGTVAFLALAWGGAVIIPAVIVYYPAFVTARSEIWQYTYIFHISHLLFALGMLLFGILTWRNQKFPRPAAGLIMLGSLLGAIDAPLDLGVFDPPFGPIMLASLGFVWMGFKLWRGEMDG